MSVMGKRVSMTSSLNSRHQGGSMNTPASNSVLSTSAPTAAHAHYNGGFARQSIPGAVPKRQRRFSSSDEQQLLNAQIHHQPQISEIHNLLKHGSNGCEQPPSLARAQTRMANSTASSNGSQQSLRQLQSTSTSSSSSISNSTSKTATKVQPRLHRAHTTASIMNHPSSNNNPSSPTSNSTGNTGNNNNNNSNSNNNYNSCSSSSTRPRSFIPPSVYMFA
ncbi:hypothetical protein RhiirA4_399877, partial [Rhizophagus irregularis]